MISKKFYTSLLWAFLAVILSLPSTAKAQEKFTSSELDTLVATIALYPDPLLIQVLTASTYGDQISPAYEWAEKHSSLKGEALAKALEQASLPYDASVQALIPFPKILSTMSKYSAWTDQLGDAVSIQKDDVMDAIQRMRNTAYRYGHLRSNDQVNVSVGATIVIQPVQTQYVYVPVYNPRVVYYGYANGYPALHYGYGAWLGSWYGAWGWGSCWFEWDSHLMFVRDYRWYPRRHIPGRPHHYAPPPRPSHDLSKPRPLPSAKPQPHYSSQNQTAAHFQSSPQAESIKSSAASAKSNQLFSKVKSEEPKPSAAPSQKSLEEIQFEEFQNERRRSDSRYDPRFDKGSSFNGKDQRQSNESRGGKSSTAGGNGGFGRSIRK